MSEYIEYEVSRKDIKRIANEFQRRINAYGFCGRFVLDKIGFELWAQKARVEKGVCGVEFLSKTIGREWVQIGFLKLKEGDIIRFPKEMPGTYECVKFDIVTPKKENNPELVGCGNKETELLRLLHEMLNSGEYDCEAKNDISCTIKRLLSGMAYYKLD